MAAGHNVLDPLVMCTVGHAIAYTSTFQY